MNYLFILDLSGTLIEAAHVCYRRKSKDTNPYINEYYSRINLIGRRLNKLMENNNRVVILTSEDHCVIQDLELIIRDINNKIFNDNKDRIEYFVESPGKLKKSIYRIMENGNTIVKVSSKSIAYDIVLDMYKNYYPVTIDDRPLIECFSKVLQRKGECFFIRNEFNSFAIPTSYFLDLAMGMQRHEKKHHIKDNVDTLIKYYDFCRKIFEDYEENIPEYQRFSVEKTYEMLYDGTLNIEKLYNWLNYTDIKKDFVEIGYSLKDIESLIEHHCIECFPSFEMVYQKRLLPKLKR